MKVFRITFILICFFALAHYQLHAQSTKRTIQKKKPKVEKNFWKDQMWYGGGFNLNFTSTYLTGTSYPGNLVYIGLSPLAGYKITSWWSVGPRLEVGYIGGRFSYSPEVLKLNGFNFGFGAFTRLKFAHLLFAHIENSTISSLYLTGAITPNNRLVTERKYINHTYLGLGYNPSSSWSYEIYLLYDFNADKNSTALPIQYRAGITYNF